MVSLFNFFNDENIYYTDLEVDEPIYTINSLLNLPTFNWIDYPLSPINVNDYDFQYEEQFNPTIIDLTNLEDDDDDYVIIDLTKEDDNDHDHVMD